MRSLRRFSACHGTPLLMVSDNGKTFKSAAREITKLMNDPGVKQYFANARMKWTFNLEKAPWWGGIFERLVRSVKRCLKKTIGGATLTYEELLTVVVEVEMILNCRPLSYMSGKDTEGPLTPLHLICGRRLMSLPDSNTSDTPVYDVDVQPQDLSRRMQLLSNVLNHFWKRWRNEYLIELRNTHRYLNQNDTIRTVSVGDAVVLHEEDQPRGKWRIGKILDVIVWSDGCTRGALVQVRSKGGICWRRSCSAWRRKWKMHETQVPSAAALPFRDPLRSSCLTNNWSKLKPEYWSSYHWSENWATSVYTELPKKSSCLWGRPKKEDLAGGSDLMKFELCYELSLSLGVSIVCKGLLTR